LNIRVVLKPQEGGMATIGMGTEVFLEDGTRLPRVRSVAISPITCDSLVTAKVEMFIGEVDVVADGDLLVTTLPNMKQYRLVPMDGGQ
jgi:hypothetical protein